MRRLDRTFLALMLALTGSATAQDLVYDTADFAAWTHPEGLVNVGEDAVRVRRFETSFNAVSNIDEFSSTTIGQFGSRPARSGSSQFSADRIRDQDESTYWQPLSSDPVQLWWIELDLGRAVVADKIRVKFPDEEGARPFQFFSVYTSPGISVFGSTTPQIVYERVGRPISNNTAQQVEFSLQTTGLRKASGAHLDTSSTEDFQIVRFVRFEAAGATPEAALAEIEVDAVGFNIATKVGTPLRREEGDPHWGGTTWTSKDRDCDGCGKGSGADEMLDQDLAFREWTIEGSDKGDWRVSGVWQTIDFGSIYRVNRIVFLPIVSGRSPILYGYQRDKQGPWTNFDFLVSDGSPSNNADPVTEGPYAYDILTEVANGTDPSTDPRFRSDFGRHLFDFNFDPVDMRMFVWRVTSVPQFSRALQLFFYHAEGYPTQVVLESDDLSLGGARSIQRIEWDADLPAGTHIEVDTQTGEGFTTITKYFLVNGREVTKAAWDAAKSRNRGPTVEEQVRDDTWSDWSDPHRFSGQDFQSPSPRQWLRVRVRMISDDGQNMPTLRSLRFVANNPVISAGLRGRVWPREAAVDSLQLFRYTITPSGTSPLDIGFDQVVITIPPGAADVSLVDATVGGSSIEATSSVVEDSLIVSLSGTPVRRDSMEILFNARLTESPTVFDAFVLKQSQSSNRQGVVPEDFSAQRVFLPDAIASRSLVRHLEYSEVFTPNDDLLNDVFSLDFTVVRTDRTPKVSIYTLAGQQLTALEAMDAGAGRARFEWDGRADGALVPPGAYIVRIEIDADAKTERINRTVHVAY